MRQKFVRKLRKVDVKIDDLIGRLEEIQYAMSSDESEESDEVDAIIGHLQDARYALNDVAPEAA